MIYTLGIAAAVVIGTLGLYMTSLKMGCDISYARTMAFVGLGFFTVYNAYSRRSLEESILRMNPLGNKTLLLGITGSILSILAVYRYAHDEPEAYAAGEHYFPDDLVAPPRFYTPTPRGLEGKIGERLAYLRALDARARPREK